MSLYKRGNVYWYNFVFKGRRVQSSTKVENKNDARDIERAAWNQLARGEVGLPVEGAKKSQTIGELLDGLESNYTAEGSISPQKRSLLKAARRAFGSKVATKLTSADVESYIAARRKEGKKNATINRVTEILRRAYRLARITPPEIRHLSEKDNARHGFFTAAEFVLIESNLSADLRDFARFGFLTGWRKGEIASLEWSDIRDGAIFLRAEHSKNREARSVPISGELVQLVERQKQARPVAVGKGTALSSFVFHRAGEPILEFRKSWQTACVTAGFGKMVCPKCGSEGAEKICKTKGCQKRREYSGRIFHDLRRSAVKNLVDSGVNQKTAMEISGHKTDAMFRRYHIVTQKDKSLALERVQEHNKIQQNVVSM